jgi:hypothetical protein
VAEPRRVLIDWDYGAHGIWWVLTKEEKEAPAPPGRWSGVAPPHPRQRSPWSDRLSSDLLSDLQQWNDAWDSNADIRSLQERGRDLAIQVQDELGTDGWEVLYKPTSAPRQGKPPAARAGRNHRSSPRAATRPAARGGPARPPRSPAGSPRTCRPPRSAGPAGYCRHHQATCRSPPSAGRGPLPGSRPPVPRPALSSSPQACRIPILL